MPPTSDSAERPGTPYTWVGGDNTCFGCSQTNGSGLHLEFWLLDDLSVECRWTPPVEMNGAPGIVHGGVQAALLDECMGYACHAMVDDFQVVTAEMNLRYRSPVRTGQALIGHAQVVRQEGRNFFLEGRIDDTEGTTLTVATARFVNIGERHPSADTQ